MNKKLLERTIRNLKAWYDWDHEVMEDTDAKQLLDNIAELEKMLPVESTELQGFYCPSEDVTFVMKCTYLNGEVYRQECVGWYHGEPTDSDNEYYSKGQLEALYDWADCINAE